MEHQKKAKGQQNAIDSKESAKVQVRYTARSKMEKKK